MDAVEVCRRSCGGHGFLMASGLCSLLMDGLGSVTYEGENTVMYLQTAKYVNLLSFEYLAAVRIAINLVVSCDDYAGSWWRTLPWLSKVELQHALSLSWPLCLHRVASDHQMIAAISQCWSRLSCAEHICEHFFHHTYEFTSVCIARILYQVLLPYSMTQMAATKLNSLVQSGQAEYEAWNNCSVDLVRTTKVRTCHSGTFYFMFHTENTMLVILHVTGLPWQLCCCKLHWVFVESRSQTRSEEHLEQTLLFACSA